LPRTNKTQTPSDVLKKFIDDYQTNAFALSKILNVAYQSVTFILNEKTRISPKMALRLSTHFGNPVKYWLDIQTLIIKPKDFNIPIVSENSTCVFICNDIQTAYYILGILNLKLIDFYSRLFNSNTHVAMPELNRLPILKPNKEQFNKIKLIVQEISKAKSKNNTVDTSELERQLNNYVYFIYNLSYNDVKVIEPDFPFNENEFNKTKKEML